MLSWTERIEQAKERGHFTNEDREDATSWVTCACGRQDPRIPRGPDGEPWDSELADLGYEFSYAVGAGNTNRAAGVLAEIDKQALRVLKEEGHELE